MRMNAVRGPILVSVLLIAAIASLVTSSHAASGASVSASGSASPAASAPASASASPSPAPTDDEVARLGTFYRWALDVRPDMPGITERQYYYIGQAFCTRDELSQDQFIAVQQAYAMPAATLAVDQSLATAMVEAAPMTFIEQNQALFGFSAGDLDTATLNAFRLKLCQNHQLWFDYERYVLQQLGSLGPWQTDPAYNDPAVAAQLWKDDLSAWQSALEPWLPTQWQAS